MLKIIILVGVLLFWSAPVDSAMARSKQPRGTITYEQHEREMLALEHEHSKQMEMQRLDDWHRDAMDITRDMVKNRGTTILVEPWPTYVPIVPYGRYYDRPYHRSYWHGRGWHHRSPRHYSPHRWYRLLNNF